MVMRDTVDASWALQYVGQCHGGQWVWMPSVPVYARRLLPDKVAAGTRPTWTSGACGVVGTGQVEGVHEVIRWR